MENIYFSISYSTANLDFSSLSSYPHYNWRLIAFSSIFFCRSKKFKSSVSPFIPKSCFPHLWYQLSSQEASVQCQRHCWTTGNSCSPWTSGNEDEMRLSCVQHIDKILAPISAWPNRFKLLHFSANQEQMGGRCDMAVHWKSLLIDLASPPQQRTGSVYGSGTLKIPFTVVYSVYTCCYPIRGEAVMKY